MKECMYKNQVAYACRYESQTTQQASAYMGVPMKVFMVNSIHYLNDVGLFPWESTRKPSSMLGVVCILFGSNMNPSCPPVAKPACSRLCDSSATFFPCRSTRTQSPPPRRFIAESMTTCCSDNK